MNELGLPPHGREPSFAADEEAYGTVVGRALARRRTRAVATTSATGVVAVLAVVALTASGGTQRAVVQPADDLASTRTPSPAQTPSASGTADRGVLVGRVSPTALVPVPLPTGATPPPPAPTATPTSHAPGRRPAWREAVATDVADRPGVECDVIEPTDSWCFRFIAPDALTSGAAATFQAELCRRPGRAANRVDLTNESELFVWVHSGDADGDEVTDAYVYSPDGAERPHSRTVREGQCVRWTKTWNGVAEGGGALPPGQYSITVIVLGETPHDPVPGAGSQEDHVNYGYMGKIDVR